MHEENEYVQDEVVEQEENTTTEETEQSNDDTVTLTKSEYSKLKRQAIAYKANRSEKPEVRETQTTTNSLSEQDIEAKILIAKGLDSQLVQEMKTLATMRGKSLLEMENDPIILAMKEVKEAEAKAKAARLGASKGSSAVRKEKTFSAPLSADEHKALWREQFNK